MSWSSGGRWAPRAARTARRQDTQTETKGQGQQRCDGAEPPNRAPGRRRGQPRARQRREVSVEHRCPWERRTMPFTAAKKRPLRIFRD